MLRAAALYALMKETPFNDLASGKYWTIWLEKKADTFVVSARSKADNSVAKLNVGGVAEFVAQLDVLLADAGSVDVRVGEVSYGITKDRLAGGGDYTVTEHERIPPSQRGVPSIVI